MKIVISQLKQVGETNGDHLEAEINYTLQHKVTYNDHNVTLHFGENEVNLELSEKLRKIIKMKDLDFNEETDWTAISKPVTYNDILNWIDTNIVHIVFGADGKYISMDADLYPNITKFNSK